MKILNKDPYLITSSNVIAGVISMELIKYIQSNGLNGAKDCFASLSPSLIMLMEPSLSKLHKSTNNKKLSHWQNIEMTGDLSLKNVIFILKHDHLVEPDKISYKDMVIYDISQVISENLDLNIPEILRNMGIVTQNKLELTVTSKNLDLFIPKIKLINN